MRNIRLTIEYDGTNYSGWQIQNSSQLTAHSSQTKTIQETIEKTLQRILQEKIKLIASGRTDSGVHALAQVVNFRTSSKLPTANILRALNSLLPQDISSKQIGLVNDDFNARYSAKSKIYRYRIHNSSIPCVFFNKYSWHIPHKIDIRLIRYEARVLLGCHDFKSFCASGSGAKTTIRTIKNISIKAIDNTLYANCYTLIVIDIEADGFLYNMVRNIVGTLVEIARGRFKAGSMKKILQAKDRRLAGPPAPAQGLFLVKVKY